MKIYNFVMINYESEQLKSQKKEYIDDMEQFSNLIKIRIDLYVSLHLQQLFAVAKDFVGKNVGKKAEASKALEGKVEVICQDFSSF